MISTLSVCLQFFLLDIVYLTFIVEQIIFRTDDRLANNFSIVLCLCLQFDYLRVEIQVSLWLWQLWDFQLFSHQTLCFDRCSKTKKNQFK